MLAPRSPRLTDRCFAAPLRNFLFIAEREGERDARVVCSIGRRFAAAGSCLAVVSSSRSILEKYERVI